MAEGWKKTNLKQARKSSGRTEGLRQTVAETLGAMNNNKSDEAALLGHCHGVFAKASYIDIGNKECAPPHACKVVVSAASTTDR